MGESWVAFRRKLDVRMVEEAVCRLDRENRGQRTPTRLFGHRSWSAQRTRHKVPATLYATSGVATRTPLWCVSSRLLAQQAPPFSQRRCLLQLSSPSFVLEQPGRRHHRLSRSSHFLCSASTVLTRSSIANSQSTVVPGSSRNCSWLSPEKTRL